MTLCKGTRLGSYEILSPIGEGGMGEVYLASDARLGREVAVKVLPIHMAHDSEAIARFRREAFTLAWQLAGHEARGNDAVSSSTALAVFSGSASSSTGWQVQRPSIWT